ncbi:MAG TPA: AAA family ATPase [Candidatus Binatia bacterium]|jgi:predicted ABC-type ATPase
MASLRPSRIYVIAGVNGSGKSSIGGATFRQNGGEYYNPDEAARKLMAANPTLTQVDANSAAWHQGVKLLKRAITEHKDFAFETTLGANTIPRLLAQAAAQGIEIYIWYVGLSNAELHIERVQARVRQGGHAIAAEHIRRRYEHSRLNLIDLLPQITALRVYDNSVDADPAAGKTPKPKLVLHLEHGKILNARNLKQTPVWTKPIVAAALKLRLS